MVWTNSNGKHKCLMIFILKSKSPRFFLDYTACTQICRSKNNSWIYFNLFQDWVISCHESLSSLSGGTWVLLLDNVNWHGCASNPPGVKFWYFPQKNTSTFELMDQSVKHKYRKVLLQPGNWRIARKYRWERKQTSRMSYRSRYFRYRWWLSVLKMHRHTVNVNRDYFVGFLRILLVFR